MSEPARDLDDEPFDDRPVYGERRRRALRITVLIALGALVLPLMLSAYSVARSAADRACAIYVDARRRRRRRVPGLVRALRRRRSRMGVLSGVEQVGSPRPQPTWAYCRRHPARSPQTSAEPEPGHPSLRRAMATATCAVTPRAGTPLVLPPVGQFDRSRLEQPAVDALVDGLRRNAQLPCRLCDREPRQSVETLNGRSRLRLRLASCRAVIASSSPDHRYFAAVALSPRPRRHRPSSRRRRPPRGRRRAMPGRLRGP